MPTPNPADPNVGPDDFLDPEPAAAPAPATTEPLRARGAIDWSRTRLTPAFVRALAASQRAAQTVGQDSKMEAGEGQKARMYANGDAMTEEATRVFGDHGIAWVTATSTRQPTDKRHADECGEKQWVCSIVQVESVLMHAPDDATQEDEVGVLVTYAETASIGRRSTPIDKADAAAESFLRLYLARNLAALDRGKADDDVNQRNDTDAGDRRVQSASTALNVVAERRKFEARWKQYAQLYKQRNGAPPSDSDYAEQAGWDDPDAITAEQYEAATADIVARIDAMRTEARRG